MNDKVSATPAALQLIEEIIADHGPVLFHDPADVATALRLDVLSAE